MRAPKSRRQIQERIRAALIAELDRMDLPSDGRHLSRVFRALTHAAVEMMQAVGVPDPVTSQLLLRVAKKSLKSAQRREAAGLFGPLPEGKA